MFWFLTGMFTGIVLTVVLILVNKQVPLNPLPQWGPIFFKRSNSFRRSNLDLAEEIPAGITLSKSENLIYANRSFYELTGYHEDEVINRMSILDIVHQEERPAMEALLRAGDILQDTNRRFEFRAVNKSGRTMYLEIYMSSYADHVSGETSTLTTYFDVTDRILIEQQLRVSEEQFRDMFYKHSAIMLLVDPVTGEIVDFNERAAVFYGFSRRSRGYRSLYEINLGAIPFETNDDNQPEYPQSKDRLFRHRIAHDGIRSVEAHTGPVSVSGRDLRFYVIHDVTERLLYERERAELIRDLKAFGHTVSHNLRNSLNVIIGRSSLLEKNPIINGEEKVLKTIQTIRRAGDKMNDIMSTLLLFATVSHKDLELETFSIDETIHSALDRLSDQIQETGALIRKPPAWPRALGYAPWIEEVWFNFISNAIKYGGDPPIIELGFDLTEHNDLIFWVQDNGAGVKTEYRNRLFTPFTRLEEGVKGGHGLGLSIVKRIVEKLGGEAGLTGEPDSGSMFYFTLKSPENRSGESKGKQKDRG